MRFSLEDQTEMALDLTVQFADKHEYKDPDSGRNQFSAFGFAQDIVRTLELLNAAETDRHPRFEVPVARDIAVGDYVFACRWSDADPHDPWHLGTVTELQGDYVIVGDVTPRRWVYAMKIDYEQGARIAEEYPSMEHEPLDYVKIAQVFGYLKDKQ